MWRPILRSLARSATEEQNSTWHFFLPWQMLILRLLVPSRDPSQSPGIYRGPQPVASDTRCQASDHAPLTISTHPWPARLRRHLLSSCPQNLDRAVFVRGRRRIARCVFSLSGGIWRCHYVSCDSVCVRLASLISDNPSPSSRPRSVFFFFVLFLLSLGHGASSGQRLSEE